VNSTRVSPIDAPCPGHLAAEAVLGLAGDADPRVAGLRAEAGDEAGDALGFLGVGGALGGLGCGEGQEDGDLLAVDRHVRGGHTRPFLGEALGEPGRDARLCAFSVCHVSMITPFHR
jgi:hypothetical protein